MVEEQEQATFEYLESRLALTIQNLPSATTADLAHESVHAEVADTIRPVSDIQQVSIPLPLLLLTCRETGTN